jgi:DNA polymerase V
MVRFAAMGYDHPWTMRQAHLSKRYTTQIDEVLIINRKAMYNEIKT